MAAASRVTSVSVEHQGMAFDCLACGPGEGEPVLLLHGFPQTVDGWRPVMQTLAAAGYHCLAPAQRGYSPGARPRGSRAYSADHLVGDALALARQHFGRQPFHLVGHDLGGLVGWMLAARHPQALRSLSILSTPHPAAYARALLTGRQAAKSWYVLVFRVPLLAERLFSAGGGAGLHRFLRAAGLDEPHASEYAQALGDRRSMAALLAWYRAWSPSLGRTGPVDVPTLYVWGEQDPALSRAGAEGTAVHVRGEYTFVPLPGVGHWLPEMHAATVADLVLQRLRGRV